MNTLDPTLEFEQFSKEEDNFIYLKFVELGPKWSTISKELIGRSVISIFNFFRRIK
jgi:myb proto-oncogene protein